MIIMTDNIIAGTKVRESSFELIRLLAQWMIVVYHIYMVHVVAMKDIPFNTSIWIPLHIGVPLFVLISGYWGIKVSGKGLFRLLGQMLVYTVPLLLLYNLVHGVLDGKQLVKSVLFVSNTPFWFMRTYLCLYLFSSVINKYLLDANLKNRVYLLASLISVYMGTLSGMDPALYDGKNILNFLLLYVIGNTLHVYEYVWRKFSVKKLLLTWFVLNVLLVTMSCLFYENFVEKVIWKLSFPYNSPLIIVNTVLFLMLIAKKPFKSKVVNYLGSSALAIYLLHCTPLFIFDTVGVWARDIMDVVSNTYIYFLCIVLLGLMISLVCIAIDKILTPLWIKFSNWGVYVENTVKSISNKYLLKI